MDTLKLSLFLYFDLNVSFNYTLNSFTYKCFVIHDNFKTAVSKVKSKDFPSSLSFLNHFNHRLQCNCPNNIYTGDHILRGKGRLVNIISEPESSSLFCYSDCSDCHL